MTQDMAKIWVFDEGKLNEALTQYREAAVAQYPHQQERIDMTLLAVRDFLDSPFADKLTMKVKGSPQKD